MKKKHVILLSLLLAVSAAGLSGCSNSNAGTPEDPVTKVVMVTDTEGMEEGSFNALIWAGVERASRDMGVSVECLESVSEEDYETNLDKAASQGADLVLSAGYLLSDATQAVAARYPDTKFAILDTAGGEADNVLGLVFANHEGAFLMGVAAALNTETGTVGFLGGDQSQVIESIEYGYRAGVKAVNPDAKVLVEYTGSFSDAQAGKSLSQKMNGEGADVIMHASGNSGFGLIEAAGESGFWAIGIDRDQSSINPEAVLCSMVKRLDNAAYLAIEKLNQGSFEGGTLYFGLEVDGVDWSDDAGNLTPEVTEALTAYRSAIQAKEFVVPATREEFEGFEVPKVTYGADQE